MIDPFATTGAVNNFLRLAAFFLGLQPEKGRADRHS